MLSNVLNYQRELISLFERFLQTTGASTKTQKNYISDLRHFFSWLTPVIENSYLTFESVHTLVLAIDLSIVLMYKQALWEAQTPVATINRRLSSLRSFFDCTTQANITKINPLSHLENIDKNINLKVQNQQIITEYLAYTSEESNEFNRLKTSTHIDEFLNWVRKRTR